MEWGKNLSGDTLVCASLVPDLERGPGKGPVDAQPGGPARNIDSGVTKLDVTKILEELRQEREQLEEAILSLERLARGRGRRRGRPPSWMVEAKKRGRPVGSKNKTTGAKSAASAAA